MPRSDYEGHLARVYDTGRRLEAAVIEAWGQAVYPYLAGLGRGLVVDLGAGTGRFSGYLAEWSSNPVIAVEPAVAMAAKARAKSIPNVCVLVGRAEAIPLNDGAARAVWLSQVIHHISDLGRAASELSRVIPSGGRLLVRGALGRDPFQDDHDTKIALYEYFPAARLMAEGFPNRRCLLNTLGAVGFEEEASANVAQQTAGSLRELYDRVASRAHSTLAALDDAVFEEGLEALGRDARSESVPTPIIDHLPLTVLRKCG